MSRIFLKKLSQVVDAFTPKYEIMIDHLLKEILNHLGLWKARRKLQYSTPKPQPVSTEPLNDSSDSRDATSYNGLNHFTMGNELALREL